MTTGSGDTTHIALASEPTTVPGNRPPTNRRPQITALACVGVLCLVLVLVIGGGAAYLIVQRTAPDQMETAPLELDGFSTVVPTGWADGEDPRIPSTRLLAALVSPDSQQTLAIARATDDVLEPDDVCSLMLDLAKAKGLATVSAEVLDPVIVDGVDAIHERWVSFADGQWHQGDMYCMADGTSSLLVLAENSSDEEATESPAAEVMLQNWTWRPEEATTSQG
ncbi:MAG: hypothetical protein ACTH6N_15940 [Brachybacterium tyrofermentans]|uniref:hypothetical protein n=1 Tax=Brachybacterium tyrofermentans TaxID=47848 RepID=UPI0018689E0B|nr:hypothetical protein [Brachybacterium tyrofermentans]